MTSIRVRSFAKLNLALDVLDKRPDGYHNIESVIQPISLYDDLLISHREDAEVTVRTNDESVPSGKGNLAHSACVMFLKAARVGAGVDIEITKAIPAQAGLGGGSGNAAAALVSLNEMHGRPLGPSEMQKLCWNLGSDVPFFLAGGTAFVSGRGETVSPLPDCQLDFVIVKPAFGVSTGWAYSRLSPARTWAYASRTLAEALVCGERERIAASMSNDFQPVVEEDYPEVAEIRKALLELGADGAMLAGSGSAVFGVFLHDGCCEQAYEALKGKYAQVYRARSVSRRELPRREPAGG